MDRQVPAKAMAAWRLGARLARTPAIRRVIRRTYLTLVVTLSVGAGLFTIDAVDHIYFDRSHLPDIEPFMRFGFPTIGRVVDANGQSLIEFAKERRQITQYEAIPAIVRDAVLAAEDKNFFSHNGVDYSSVPRVLAKVRIGALLGGLVTGGRHDDGRDAAIFPQGGSTITQQLVRGVFLKRQTTAENSYQLQSADPGPRVLSWIVGARSANMVLRKREEIRLSLWLEAQMRERFGSKRRAKEEIFARYVSYVYMGNGQYGFARAAEYYLGRSLSSFTADDADKASLLAGIMKSPRDNAPTATDTGRILRRRNQTLELMARRGLISRIEMTRAVGRPLLPVVRRPSPRLQSSAVVEHVLSELTAARPDLGLDDLLWGHIHVYSTADLRVQRIATDALEHGLQQYEQRHTGSRGLLQGSVVVLKNRDGSVLAEVGGRQIYAGRASTYNDFNRVRQSIRQPGSAMKPIVYLAAFQQGNFTLESLVPDEPISVPNGSAGARKWISNYDGQFKGLIPLRQALAESRNAVAIWITGQIGIESVLRSALGVGVQTSLSRYPTTALGASEITLLELATAYRTIASGVLTSPYVIKRITNAAGEMIPAGPPRPAPVTLAPGPLALIQEGLLGVVRLPTGTAHALASRAFPIAVMGKTGTTNDFRDAIFVGSTYGADGITVAVRIGFDDSRSLGRAETGGRLALPVFQEIMLKVYRDQIVGPVPSFPNHMEQHIARYLRGETVATSLADVHKTRRVLNYGAR